MRCRSLTIVLVGLFAAASIGQAGTQGRGQEEPQDGPRIIESRPPHPDTYRYKPEEMPFYFVVFTFFLNIEQTLEEGDEVYEREILKPLGIKPGSGADKALRVALVQANSVPGLAATEVGDKQKHQKEYLQLKVKGLATVYARLLGWLEREGVDLLVLETLLEEVMRPQMGLSATPAPADPTKTPTFIITSQFEDFVAEERRKGDPE